MSAWKYIADLWPKGVDRMHLVAGTHPLSVPSATLPEPPREIMKEIIGRSL